MNERILERLKEVGHNQTWLADAIGMNRYTLNNKIRDRRKMTVQEMAAISLVLNISLDFLVGLTKSRIPVRYQGVMKHKEKIIFLVTEVRPDGSLFSTYSYDSNKHRFIDSVEYNKYLADFQSE